MNMEEIIERLKFYDGTFPRRALEEAVARREQVTPVLLQILEEADHNVEDVYEQEDYMAHIYAMFLLAQFREKRAYPLVVDFFSAPGDIALEATGDVVTEYLSRILASRRVGHRSGLCRRAPVARQGRDSVRASGRQVQAD
jgi:hypothetical protein